MHIKNRRLGGAVLALALLSGLSVPALAQANAEIDFGDDSSEWANDGECDDPRFEGAGMAVELEDIDLGRDASDCRAAFEAGRIALAATSAAAPEAGREPEATEIDFGDDSGEWANDGECDDPRFAGSGMAIELEDIDIARDASDCRAAFEDGAITLATDGEQSAGLDFGDDSSEWANDQECDDPRFVGTGMAGSLSDDNRLRDASDCRNAFEDGSIILADDDVPANASAALASMAILANRIDFGDDSGEWPHDGQCDDPDFVGPGAYSDPYDANRLGDASDCRSAFIAGTITLRTLNGVAGGFNYGDDSSRWSNDGQCDDMRFTGPGMAKKLDREDIAADASDCRALEEEGDVSIRPVYQPDYVLGAPYDGSDIDFGDNSSPYARDNQCDDPRFEGPGADYTLLESDRQADADDCSAAFEAGTITLRDGES
ncbi:hypothetical protein [Devosia faecipullorum]|uniref:hypothetical protein n=1 Tax=Devosia faecipullorum TaxID=2755039 RepID=UPI00187B12BB|nr:hypothetical protein [Devosia faecipullorum]MBE7732800.1 hypothetical protein [Devosia faecipullorum]